MTDAESPFIEDLVAEEIRRAVANGVANGGILSIADCVAEIVSIYPNCGFSKRQIADELMMAAARIAVEIGPPTHTSHARRSDHRAAQRA